MACPLPLLELSLLLLLLPLFWAPTGAGSRELVVLAPPEVHGSPGDTIKLPCNLQPVQSKTPRVKQIRWERLESWGDSSTVVEFHWEGGPRISEPDRVRFVVAGKDQDLLNTSLIMSELHPDDDANYTCKVTTFPQGSGRASTWLRVFYAPQVSISLYDDIRQQGYRETSLSCDARCNPEPRSYEWSTTTGPLPSYAVPQGTQLLFQPSAESINTTFICRVSNDLGTAQVAMRVLLPGIPGEQSQSLSVLTIILPIVIVPVVLGLGFLTWCRCFKKSCQARRHNTSENGVSYSAARVAVDTT